MTTKAAVTTLGRDPPPPPRPTGCGGDGCDARDPWPLHHVRHRTVFCRLCTSCVLKYHAGSFCTVCFNLLDGPQPPPAPSAFVRCSRCPSIAHSACLAEADRASSFLCPSCCNSAGFSYFLVSNDGQRRSIDLTSAKVLLAAARLAAASMSRAVVASRAEVERKVKEAALARKRAREMLETVFTLSKIEKERKKKEANEAAVVPLPEVVEAKEKIPKLGSTVAANVGQKRVQNRDTDRWMKFQEPMAMVPKPVEGFVDDKSKVSSLTGMHNHADHVDMKGKVGSSPHTGNHVGQIESKDRGFLSGSPTAFVKEERG
ncbi:uncharacterized protein LOC103721210 [Phoenix dactylifera]|uniref:Uncharacterized protein LOC103721210 n=1 Tax=Phoenix dactylifera TaxID=42345 RepID=A0A8B7CZ39_PHODC|nr:uncharacterized protein LOC103721210 [Phoenix dactylifera]XP_008809537.2 uncharacterized protein LOC103721210 [Phoenix dactylifera]XP_038976969.1 uncharacterized protein LOC103721210 [Phoenix dactylifera]